MAVELIVARTVDPHSLAVTTRLADADIKAALGTEDPTDLGFDLFLQPVSAIPKAAYLRLVADLVERVEQAAALNISAGPPESK